MKNTYLKMALVGGALIAPGLESAVNSKIFQNLRLQRRPAPTAAPFTAPVDACKGKEDGASCVYKDTPCRQVTVGRCMTPYLPYHGTCKKADGDSALTCVKEWVGYQKPASTSK